MGTTKSFPSMKNEEGKKAAEYPSLFRNMIEAFGGEKVAVTILEKMVFIENLKRKLEIFTEEDDRFEEKETKIKKTPWGYNEFILVNDIRRIQGNESI
ncbi:unnamed protein product [Linum trigynum]|uniref:Uncharacterized protein n=1 Tax=Linum trigynum TaxID=586398 RepID=A0AAV2CYZ6_9ROSI